MEPSKKKDVSEKKLIRLINKLEREKQALNKILKTINSDHKQNNSNK